MRYLRVITSVLLFMGWSNATYGQQDLERLIEKSDPAIQAQIQRILDVLQKPGIDPHDVDLCREVQTLKRLSADKDVLVSQLAIFVATTKSAGETHVLILKEVLRLLNIPPRITIRVLAPYLDTDNRQLRDSVRLWFHLHDTANAAFEGATSIKPANYQDYGAYLELEVTHKQNVPSPLTRYMFERSPGRALLAFAYAHSQGDITTRPNNLGEFLEAKKAHRREIELAEHFVSSAIWLKENEFAERFQAALPEAMAELAKLTKHEEWWARLYVAYIMRQHRELRQADIMQQLSADRNELVREAAGSAKK